MRNQIWKLVLIALVLALALLALYPLDKKLKPGLDLAGGTVFVYQVEIKPGDDAKTVVESVIEVLRKRVDPTGVRNLVWRPLAGNRIEIQVPLAPKETVQLRKAFMEARKALFKSNLKQSQIESALRSGSEDRRGATLSSLAQGDAGLRERMDDMARAFETLREATGAFDRANAQLKEAETAKQNLPEDAGPSLITEADEVVEGLSDQIAEMGRSEATASDAFARTRDAVLDWNIEPIQLQAMLAPVDDWGGLKPVQRESAEAAFATEREKLIARHPDREAQIKAVAETYFAYARIKGPLDDPADLRALLRGAGVLEFRIVPSAAEVANLDVYRENLRTKGPNFAANRDFRWMVIDDIAQFADTQEERRQLEADPEQYFGDQMVGQAYRDRHYLLLGNTTDDSITESQLGWKLTDARRAIDQNAFPAVNFELNTTGGRLMSELTRERKGELMAIALDGRVITAPNIQEPLASNIRVTRPGGFSDKDQQYLVNTLNAGTLKARLSQDPISENTTGPQLGQDNLKRGLEAAIWALAVVAVFMAIYYLFGGFVADFALMANMALILGTMATLQATFTLPGIAGIVLTIGMAVDANVLIFERIREELQRSTDLRTAVRIGYQKAFVTIVDANLTTLIICLILGYTATAEVKGFAVTLGIGIVATLFTALFCTRVIVHTSLDLTKVQSMPMLPTLVPTIARVLRPDISWVSKRYALFGLSAVLVLAGILMVSSRGENLLDIEFRAGTRVGFNLKADENGRPRAMTLDEVRERLDRAGEMVPELTREAGPSVVTLGDTETEGASVQASSFAVICLSLEPRSVSTAIKKEFADVLEEESALSFRGVSRGDDTPPISADIAMPIRDRVLGKSIGRADVQADVADFLGGVSIVIDDISPAVSLRTLQDRIGRMRLDEKYANDPWYESDVIGLELAGNVKDGEPLYSSVAVVVAPDADTNYNDNASRFYSDGKGLAARQWKLVYEALRRDTSLESVVSISPQVSSTMKNRAIVAMILSLLAVVAYIWFRFGSLRYGLAAIAALVHDVVITLGLVAICGHFHDTAIGHALGFTDFKVNLALVAALLTIVGYSLNDTIVIFDRIRENRGRLATATPAIVNTSINQTISRTVLTSGTTFIAVLTLYLFGGEGVHGFAFAMLIGVLAGTYSSIAIAAPLLLIGSGGEKQSVPVAAPVPA